MLTLRRVAVVAGCAVAVAVAGTVPAFANGYGNVTCSQDPSPDCQLGAGTTAGGSGRDGTSDGQPSHGHNGSGSGRSAGSGGSGDTIVGGGETVARCSYVPSDYQPPTGAITAAYRRPSPSNGPIVQLVALTRPIERCRSSRCAICRSCARAARFLVRLEMHHGGRRGRALSPAGLHPERTTRAGCRAVAFSRPVGAVGPQPVAAAHADDRGEPGRRAVGEPPDVDVAVQRVGTGVSDGLGARCIGDRGGDADLGVVVDG